MLSFKREASGEPPPWMEDRRKNCSKEKVHLCNAFCFSHQVPLVIAFLNAHCQMFKSHTVACIFLLLLNQTIWLLESCQIMIKLSLGSILHFFTCSTFCALVAIASPWHNGGTALTFLAKRGAPIPFSDEIHFLYSRPSPTTLFIQVFSFPAVPADPTFNHYLAWCNGNDRLHGITNWTTLHFQHPLVCYLTFLSPSGDLGISLVWHNLSPPDRTGPDSFLQLFGPTVEILFKVN